MVIWVFFEDAWVGLVGTRYHVGRSGGNEKKGFWWGRKKQG